MDVTASQLEHVMGLGGWAVSYSTSQEICTRFCCALLCCGYAIVHNEFTWSIYPFSSGLLCWHWGNRWLPQCQWSKPDGYGKISQCITTTKHSKAQTVCIFLGIYCISVFIFWGTSSGWKCLFACIYRGISTLIIWPYGILSKVPVFGNVIRSCVLSDLDPDVIEQTQPQQRPYYQYR